MISVFICKPIPSILYNAEHSIFPLAVMQQKSCVSYINKSRTHCFTICSKTFLPF